MNTEDYSSLELSDWEIDEYLSICFAISKGTANVSADDRKKLHPLMRYYAKKAHPFTACVRDNRKRFGAKTEAYCAVLKDLIVGSTKWRGKGKKYVPRALSQEEFDSEYGEFKIDFPDGFNHFLSELTEEDVKSMIGDESITEVDMAEGDVVWKSSDSYEYVRMQIREHLNSFEKNESEESESELAYASSYWVEDLSPNQALVCHEGNEYFVVPYKSKNGKVTVSEEEDWLPVEKAWVETNLSEEAPVMAEMFFSSDSTVKEEDGLIWKTIMREGTWKYSPGPGGIPIPKPIKVVKSGLSDIKANTISLEELKSNFDAGVVEHVTVPTSHADKVHENTGFIKSMKLDTDDKGRTVLLGGIDFKDPEIKEKVKQGTIANCSGGVRMNYIHKEQGKQYGAVLAHVALTNHPWLNDLATFGEDEKNIEIISLSEDDETSRGGEIVSTVETEEIVQTNTFFDEIGLSEDEVKSRLARFAELEAESKKNKIDAKCKDWQDAGKSPALVKEAKSILMSDDQTLVLNFSEEGASKTLRLSEIVERLVDASASINLAEEQITEEEVSKDKPDVDSKRENEQANFSHEEKVLIGTLMFDEGLSEEKAIAETLKRLRSNTGE